MGKLSKQPNANSRIASEMHQMQLELFQIDQETAVLEPKLLQMERHGQAVKVLGHMLKFMAIGLAREILWRWRCLLSP